MFDRVRKKLSQSLDDIEDERLGHRLADLGVVRLADAPVRTPVVVAGEIQSVQVAPRDGTSSLHVTFGDGSGRATAIFTGRKRLGGVDGGRRLLVEGTARLERGALVFLNPAYTIVE